MSFGGGPAQQRAHQQRPASATIVRTTTKIEVDTPVFRRLVVPTNTEDAPTPQKVPQLNKALFTFQPQIHPSPQLARAVATRGSFLTRLQSDLDTRAQRKHQLVQQARPSFAPALSLGTQRKMARRQTTFLDRLDDDLKRRDEHARTYRKQAHSVPAHVTFVPNLSAISGRPRSPPDFDDFLERTEQDRLERREAKAACEAMLAKKFVPEKRTNETPEGTTSSFESYPRRRPHSARR